MYVVDHIRFRERTFKVLQLVGHVRAGGGGTLSEPDCGAGRGSGGARTLLARLMLGTGFMRASLQCGSGLLHPLQRATSSR
jgi:hypothetical protein